MYRRMTALKQEIQTALRAVAKLLALIALCASAAAQTAFTYQGRLNDANGSANGNFDFAFTLYTDPESDSLVAGPLTNGAVVVTNGLFTTIVDFGPGAFNGSSNWLSIAVRTNGGTIFTALSPRQPLTPAPVAIYALNGPAQTIPPGSITGSQLAAQSVSTTNLTLASAVSMVTGNIAAYGLRRFAWSNTIAEWSSIHRPFFFSTIGSGWTEDSEFGGVVTNIFSYMPCAGFASTIWYQDPVTITYGPVTGQDTALFANGDDTNWHSSYFILTNVGNIISPVAVPFSSAVNGLITSDVTSVSYLANPKAGSFAVEIRTNGDYYANFTNLDSTWKTVATVNASNTSWIGRTLWWTNSQPMLAQLRVRATSPGQTPIVDFAQWNSSVTNGVILSQYGHQASSLWWNQTDTNKVFPIWQGWRPDLILLTGGLGDGIALDSNIVTELQLMKAGFPNSDIVDVGVHEIIAPYTDVFERSYCFSQGIPYFDGQAASMAAWGSYSNGFAIGMYQDEAHLTVAGYAVFSQLLWSWLDLTGVH